MRPAPTSGRSRRRFLLTGTTLAVVHCGATCALFAWWIGDAVSASIRGVSPPAPVRLAGLALTAMHPIRPHFERLRTDLRAPLFFASCAAESAAWDFGTAYALGWLRRSLGKGRS